MTNEQFTHWLEMAWPHGFRIEPGRHQGLPMEVAWIRLPDGSERMCGVSSMTEYSWRGLAASCHDMLQHLFADHPEFWPDDATIPMPPY